MSSVAECSATPLRGLSILALKNGTTFSLSALISELDPPQVAHLALRGELDHASTATFEQALDTIGLDHPLDLYVDLHDLRLLCSAGLAALGEAHRRLASTGGSLTLSGAHGVVLAALGLVDLVPVDERVGAGAVVGVTDESGCPGAARTDRSGA